MNHVKKLTTMTDKEYNDSMLNSSEFTLLTLTPFVAAIMLIAWPITAFVFCTVMITGACASLIRKMKGSQ